MWNSATAKNWRQPTSFVPILHPLSDDPAQHQNRSTSPSWSRSTKVTSIRAWSSVISVATSPAKAASPGAENVPSGPCIMRTGTSEACPPSRDIRTSATRSTPSSLFTSPAASETITAPSAESSASGADRPGGDNCNTDARWPVTSAGRSMPASRVMAHGKPLTPVSSVTRATGLKLTGIGDGAARASARPAPEAAGPVLERPPAPAAEVLGGGSGTPGS